MKRLLTLALAACSFVPRCFADEPQPSQPPDNVYVFDEITLQSLDQWQPIGRTRLRFSHWRKEAQHFGLEAVVTISKAGQMVHGIQRRGLGLPLPRAVRFWAWGEAQHFWVILGDKHGRRVSSRVGLKRMKRREWVQVEVPLAETVPVGSGAEPIRDFDVIAILTHEAAGEFREAGPAHFFFSRFEAVYPAGTGPRNPTFTRDDLAAMMRPLDARIARIEDLVERAAGADTRYAVASLTVLNRYRGEVFGLMGRDPDPLLPRRMAESLVECATRTERQLADAIAHPEQAVRVPEVDLKNLRCREGSFFAGDRPVMLAGVCGWFSPSDFRQLAAMGYTALSFEVGPRSTVPAEGQRSPEGLDGTRIVLDAAAQHNIACDLLLSPHYFPKWARETWPSTDVTGWRQETNVFMPWTITDPHVREVIAEHLAVAIPQLRDHPALLSYDLVNEAFYRPIPDFPAEQWAAFRRAHPEMDEWQALSALTTRNVTDFVGWYVAQIHKYDTAHPIHMKTLTTEAVQSVDREAVGDLLTANGMDAMPSWPDWTGRLSADFAWPLLRHDFHRSLTPDKPIMDGECHISNGTYPMPAAYVRAALWDLALHGRDMTSCWMYGPGDAVSLYWHPEGVEALGHTALDFVRLGPEIHAFQRQRGPLAVFYGGPGLREAYRACLFQDVDVGVVTDKRVQQGRLADYRVLVVPDGCEPQRETMLRIEAFEKGGGVVVECPPGLEGEELWPVVRRAVLEARLARAVSTNMWGIECRSLLLGERRLVYLINHRRRAVELRLDSDWPLAGAVELRTGRRVDARRLRLEPLDVMLFEAG